jgi:putative Mg2+ transporter-C (MgtC) family protein
MIISKYGFFDVLPYVDYDPARIAAQIVSGIGFLGAGMIFVRKQSVVSGLTTAAGVWTTAGIGMAMGAKLYFIGIAATALMLIVQVLLHHRAHWFRIPVTEQLIMTLTQEGDALTLVQHVFSANRIKILNLKVERQDGGLVEVEMHIKLPPKFDVSSLIDVFKENPYIKSIEL